MFAPNRTGVAMVVAGMTPDQLFQRLRCSRQFVSGVLTMVCAGVGFGLVAIFWGTTGMPEWARVAIIATAAYGAGMVLTDFGGLAFELYNRRRARMLLRAGDHHRAARVVLRLARSSAHELGVADPETLQWHSTYAQVLARLGRLREAEDHLIDVVAHLPGMRWRAPGPSVAADTVLLYSTEPVDIWWPALDVREVGRRIAQSRAVLLLYAAIVLSALVVGIAVLVAGADAVPSWMRTAGTAIGLGVLLTVLQVPLQVWAGVSLLRRVDKLLARGDHEGAANNVEVIVGRHLQRGGPEDPEALRWMTTLAHLQLLRGRDRDALELLSVLRVEQRRLHGPAHPDVARTERVIAAAMAGAATRAPVETWWR
jgi:hypothetical protein